MKRMIFIVCFMIISLSASTVFAAKSEVKRISDNLAIPDKKENKLTDEEISRLTKRVEEIRDMDKTNMTVKEKRVMRKELKSIKENVKRNGGVIYIGGGTLLLIILILLLI